MCSPVRKDRPASVAIQITPCESAKHNLTFAEGRPFFIVQLIQLPPRNSSNPEGVAIQIVPSRFSVIELTSFDPSPFSVEYVLKPVPLSTDTPPLTVPAQTAPFGLLCTA